MVGEISRGLSDVKLYVLDTADLPGTGIDAPGARTLSWAADSDSENWEGDDTVMATDFNPKNGSGSLALGKSNPAAVAAIVGSTAVVSGVAPATITTVDETAQPSDEYLMIKGQAKGKDVGGTAYRVTLPKAKVGSPSESMALNTYNEPTHNVVFVENPDGLFIRREWFETAVDIPTTITP